jgi:hypothetical protein
VNSCFENLFLTLFIEVMNYLHKKKSLIPEERIAGKIMLMRGEKVMLDFHLAELYGIATRSLKQAVKRNIDRFPVDFMF